MSKLVVKIASPAKVPDSAEYISTVVQESASSDGVQWVKCHLIWHYFLVDERDWNDLQAKLEAEKVQKQKDDDAKAAALKAAETSKTPRPEPSPMAAGPGAGTIPTHGKV